jgi:hypothetical protein
LLAFSIALAAILGLSIAAIGFWIEKYVGFLVDYNRLGAELSLYPDAMQNWRGLVCSLLKTDHGVAVRSALLGLSLLSVLVVFLVCSRSSPRSSTWDSRLVSAPQREARYATAVLLGLLSSPHLYMHDWVVALPAGLVLWSFAREAYSKAFSKRFHATALLWLLGLSPMVFFVAQFIMGRLLQSIQLVPVYMSVVVAVAVLVLHTAKIELQPE